MWKATSVRSGISGTWSENPGLERRRYRSRVEKNRRRAVLSQRRQHDVGSRIDGCDVECLSPPGVVKRSLIARHEQLLRASRNDLLQLRRDWRWPPLPDDPR